MTLVTSFLQSRLVLVLKSIDCTWGWWSGNFLDDLKSSACVKLLTGLLLTKPALFKLSKAGEKPAYTNRPKLSLMRIDFFMAENFTGGRPGCNWLPLLQQHASRSIRKRRTKVVNLYYLGARQHLWLLTCVTQWLNLQIGEFILSKKQ